MIDGNLSQALLGVSQGLDLGEVRGVLEDLHLHSLEGPNSFVS